MWQPHLSFFSPESRSFPSVPRPALGQAATMGICLSLLVAFIVLLATTCNWWSSSLGLVCWEPQEPQGPLGLGTGELSIHGFFEDFYTHCEPYVFGLLVGDETWTPPTFFWVLRFDKCPRCVDIWCATWILKDTYQEEVSLLFVVHGGWLSVSWSLATAGEFFSAIVLECSRAIFCRTWIFYRLTGS